MFQEFIAYAEPAAQNAANTATQQPQGTMGAIISFLPMILIIVLLYFIMIRPQKKQQKQQQLMRDAMKVGDKVVTIGGICGTIAKIKDDFVYLESHKPGEPECKSYIKLKKSAVDSVESSKE